MYETEWYNRHGENEVAPKTETFNLDNLLLLQYFIYNKIFKIKKNKHKNKW